MKLLMALLAAIILGLMPVAAAPTPTLTKRPAVKPPARPIARMADWTKFVTRTATGNYVLGNPQARVKIVEYLSFTCPHCAEFSRESAMTLRGPMIKSGAVSLEYRPVARDQIDLGATLLARCAGETGFFAMAEALFARQDDWLSIGFRFLERDAGRFSLAPPLEQVRAGAQASGLIDLARAQGMSAARINGCFANKQGFDQMLINGDAARKEITGTPSFVINGEKIGGATWATLEPLIRAKTAR